MTLRRPLEDGHRGLLASVFDLPWLVAGPRRQDEIRELLAAFAKKHGQTQDRKVFLTDLREVDRAAGVRLSAPEIKTVLNALGERDDTGEICGGRGGNPEPDPDLRDTESVPLKEYFKCEVLPHAPRRLDRPHQNEGRIREPAQPPLLSL